MALSPKDVEDITLRAMGLESRNMRDIDHKIKSLQDNIDFIQNTKVDNSMFVDHSSLVHHTLERVDQIQNKDKSEAFIINMLSQKVDNDVVTKVQKHLASRLSILENSVLKGFKAICDKIVVSLGDKTSKQDFEGFKAHTSLLLGDIVETLKTKMPGARALLYGKKQSKTCLSCESPILISRDQTQSSSTLISNFVEPEVLPEPSVFKHTSSLIHVVNPIGASRNAKLMQCKRERDALRRSQVLSPMDMASIKRPCESPRDIN